MTPFDSLIWLYEIADGRLILALGEPDGEVNLHVLVREGARWVPDRAPVDPEILEDCEKRWRSDLLRDLRLGLAREDANEEIASILDCLGAVRSVP